MCGQSVADADPTCATCGESLQLTVGGRSFQPTPVTVQQVLEVSWKIFRSRSGSVIQATLWALVASSLLPIAVGTLILQFGRADDWVTWLLFAPWLFLWLSTFAVLAARNAIHVIDGRPFHWREYTRIPMGALLHVMRMVMGFAGPAMFLALFLWTFTPDVLLTLMWGGLLLAASVRISVSLLSLFLYAEHGGNARARGSVRSMNSSRLFLTTPIALFFVLTAVLLLVAVATLGVGLVVALPFWWHTHAVAYLMLSGRLRA